jgi:hypothetical protein
MNKRVPYSNLMGEANDTASLILLGESHAFCTCVA